MSGYAIVDVDDDQNGNLQFKSFLNDTPAAGPSSSTAGPSSSRAQTTSHEAPYSVFNLAYYQVYFDVDTWDVGKRVGLAMIPRGGFINDVCEGHVDMYGPFWTLSTLILLLYTTSTLTDSVTAYMAGKPAETNIPLLSTATSLIYIYGLAVPAGLWGVTRWLGVGEWGPAEALAIYGYAMSIFVPVSLLCLIPIGILRWALVGAGALSSGFFLVTNIYPVLASADNKLVRLLIIGVAVIHAGVALAMKIMFYSYSVGGVEIGPDPIESPIDPVEGAQRIARWLMG